MSEYDNNMRGVLFKNKKKTTEKHPDYTGSCEINNTKIWISGWIKESKNGNMFLSLSFTPDTNRQEKSHDMDDIPF